MAGSIPSIHLSNKKKPNAIFFTLSQVLVLVYRSLADRQTDISEKVLLLLLFPDQELIYMFIPISQPTPTPL